MSKIDVDKIGQHTKALEDALESGDFREVLGGAVRDRVLQSFRDNFTGSRSASGEVWPPRKIRGDGHPLLIESGALLQAATGGGAGHVSEVTPRELSLGVDRDVKQGGIPGAAVHNFGFARFNIPRRAYHEARDDALDEIEETIADFGLELLGGV